MRLALALFAPFAAADLLKVQDDIFSFRSNLFMPPNNRNIYTRATIFKTAKGWTMIDTADFSVEDIENIKKITEKDGGVKHIINVHPYHTRFVERTHQNFPEAIVYVTARHREIVKNVPFSNISVESLVTYHKSVFPEFQFDTPPGAVLTNEKNTHANSIVVYHPASKTLHIADTLVYTTDAEVAQAFGISTHTLSLHPDWLDALDRNVSHPGKKLAAWFTKKFIDGEWKVANALCSHLEPMLKGDKSEEESFLKVKNDVASSLNAWADRLQLNDAEASEIRI